MDITPTGWLVLWVESSVCEVTSTRVFSVGPRVRPATWVLLDTAWLIEGKKEVVMTNERGEVVCHLDVASFQSSLVRMCRKGM